MYHVRRCLLRQRLHKVGKLKNNPNLFVLLAIFASSAIIFRIQVIQLTKTTKLSIFGLQTQPAENTRKKLHADSPTRPASLDDLLQLPLLLWNITGTSAFPTLPLDLDESYEKDYGGLSIDILEDGQARMIYFDSRDEKTTEYEAYPSGYQVPYYAFDDDFVRSTDLRYDDKALVTDSQRCRRVNWHRYQFPICNVLHEEVTEVDYIASGSYRDVFVESHVFDRELEHVIFKQIRFEKHLDFTTENFEYVRMDALVSERLTSHPRIVDIYGYCGLSMLSEYLPHGDLESVVVPSGGLMQQDQLNASNEVDPQNDLNATTKLIVALEMAEALSALHGFEGGVIVHDDVQLPQFLFASDGSVKLNDFNRAEIMLWDEENFEYFVQSHA